MKKLYMSVALTALLGACAQTGPQTTDGEIQWPDPDSASWKKGTFPNVEQLRRMGPGMTKDQVRFLVNVPHFGEGIFGSSQWNYLFHFRTGKGNEYVTCQYQVAFKDGVSDALHWRDPACAEHLTQKKYAKAPMQPMPAERFRLSADALFAFDKSSTDDLLPNGTKTLEQFATALKTEYKRLEKVSIIGHTDRLGSDEYNRLLSVARATTVLDYLIREGVPASVVQAHGVGESQPVVQCSDTLVHADLLVCLQPNRRVELEVIGER